MIPITPCSCWFVWAAAKFNPSSWFSQARSGSLFGLSDRSEGRQDIPANAPITHRSSWSSSAPSAGWSTSSPAASWGTSQTGVSAHTADQGSSGQSLVQKAKEYMPGFNSSQYTEQNNAGQMHRTTEVHDIPVASSLSTIWTCRIFPSCVSVSNYFSQMRGYLPI